MSNEQTYPPGNRQLPVKTPESDLAFLERQFYASVQALERVHALQPGEFDELMRHPAFTEQDRTARSARHQAIARRALLATQHGQLMEEDFNIWSGRRKENGQPVKFRFERCYTNLASSELSRKRGTLTGIVRAYQHLVEEMIDKLAAEAETAKTAAQLLAIERKAIQIGLLKFETYAQDYVNGWPTYLRSTGRFRGTVRLRELFERRQEELDLPAKMARVLLREIDPYVIPSEHAPASVTREPGPVYHTRKGASNTPFRWLLSRVARFFQ